MIVIIILIMKLIHLRVLIKFSIFNHKQKQIVMTNKDVHEVKILRNEMNIERKHPVVTMMFFDEFGFVGINFVRN